METIELIKFGIFIISSILFLGFLLSIIFLTTIYQEDIDDSVLGSASDQFTNKEKK